MAGSAPVPATLQRCSVRPSASQNASPGMQASAPASGPKAASAPAGPASESASATNELESLQDASAATDRSNATPVVRVTARILHRGPVAREARVMISFPCRVRIRSADP
jgi:hypothetical protein